MISLVSTILNDITGLQLFFEQMESQTQKPDEIVIIDAGSTDASWELLQDYQLNGSIPLQCYQELGCNVARGRNLAIEKAQYKLIASTDIGCSWDAEWLESLTSPLLHKPTIQAVMGSWDVQWEKLESDWAKIDYCLHGDLKFIATPKSHASSRSIAYQKSLWQKIGGYPEDLSLAGDDMVFAMLLHPLTNHIEYISTPHCHWKRPVDLRSFCKEAKRNFKGGGEAGIWLEYGVLVGGRLIFEMMFLSLSIYLLLFAHLNWISLALMTASLLSISLRILRLSTRVQQFRIQNSSHTWLKFITFEYMTKLFAILGYWEGFIGGFTQCQDCRARLKQVS